MPMYRHLISQRDVLPKRKDVVFVIAIIFFYYLFCLFFFRLDQWITEDIRLVKSKFAEL
jgi:hypothetical protein